MMAGRPRPSREWAVSRTGCHYMVRGTHRAVSRSQAAGPFTTLFTPAIAFRVSAQARQQVRAVTPLAEDLGTAGPGPGTH